MSTLLGGFCIAKQICTAVVPAAPSRGAFSVSSPPVLLGVMTELLETNEDFRNQWEQHNLKVLGLTATDLYDIYTKEPLTGIDDITGMKNSAPGVLGNWLRGTDANAVDGALTTFYTDVQTGISDGALTLALGAIAVKLYEVALYINRDSWDGLPEDVQNAMVEAGSYYTTSHGEDLVARHEFVLNKMVELGADLSMPVTIVKMPKDETLKWANKLPDIAADWAAPLEARGIPAKAFLSDYMNGLRAKGETPSRDWDK